MTSRIEQQARTTDDPADFTPNWIQADAAVFRQVRSNRSNSRIPTAALLRSVFAVQCFPATMAGRFHQLAGMGPRRPGARAGHHPGSRLVVCRQPETRARSTRSAATSCAGSPASTGSTSTAAI